MRFFTTYTRGGSLLLFSFLLLTTLRAQDCDPTIFVFSDEEYAGNVHVDNHPDGGYLLAGEVNNTASGSGRDLHIIRSDGFGNAMWTQTVVLPEHEACTAVRCLPDGSIVLLASVDLINNTDSGAFFAVLKLDATGNLLWTEYFSASGTETTGTDLAVLPNGQLIVSAYRESLWSGGFDVGTGYILLLDADGQEVRSRQPQVYIPDEQTGFPEPAMPILMNATVCENGDYVFSGWARAPAPWWPTPGYFVAIRTDAELNTIWEFAETYGSCLSPVGWDMAEGTDGRLFFASDMTWTGCYDVFGYTAMMELSADGQSGTFHNLDFPYTGGKNILLDDDGHLIIGHRSGIRKVRNDGIPLWESPTVGSVGYGATNNTLIPSENDGFIVSMRQGNELWLVEFDSLGNNCSNYLGGEVYLDVNGNCERDSNDVLLPDVMIDYNNGQEFVNTSSQGYYSFQTGLGVYTVEASLPNELWEHGCPPSGSYTGELTETYQNPDQLDFALHGAEACPLLEVEVNLRRARICQEQTLTLQYCNYGTIAATDAYIEVELPEVLEVLAADLPWTEVDGSLRFTVGDVGVYDCASFSIQVLVGCDAELGTEACVNAEIFPQSLCDLANVDHSDIVCRTLTNSYDPNDKLVVAADTSACWNTARDKLDFTIRFQNTGNDTAYQVVIIDTLSTDLDLSTFLPGPSSHAYNVRVLPGRQLMFSFPGINLLDSMSNEADSQGFVQFSIYPAADIANYTIIRNRAGIYFDSNPPIITPYAELEQCLMVPLTIVAVASEDISNCAEVNGQISITANGGEGEYLYSIDNGASWQAEADFVQLPAGSYTILLQDEAGTISTYAANPLVLEELSPTVLDFYTQTPNSCGGDDGRIVLDVLSEVPSFYSIDGGENWLPGSTIYNLAPGTYEVMIGNACGTGVVLNATVADLEPPVFTEVLTFNPDCDTANGTIRVMGEGVRTLRYSIDGGETWTVSRFFHNLPPGSYTPLVSYGAGNCVVAYEEEVVLLNDDPLTANIEVEASPPNACDEINGQIIFVGGDGTEHYSIDGGLSYQEQPVFLNLPSGEYHPIISNGCSDFDSLGVLDLQGPQTPQVLDVLAEAPNCGAADGSLAVEASGGVALEFSINGGLDYQPSSNFLELPAGTYLVQVRNADGCESEPFAFELIGSVIPTITEVEAQLPSCSSNSGSLTIAAMGGNSLGYSIDGGISYQTGNSFTDLPSGTYELSVRNAAGCVSEVVSYDLQGSVLPEITALSGTDPSCGMADGTLSITATGGESLEYSIDGGASYYSSSTFTALGAGSYEVLVRNAAECVSEAGSIELVGSEPPQISQVEAVDPDCDDSNGVISISAEGAGALLFTINGWQATQTTPIFDGLPAGVYHLAVRDSAGCETDLISVTLSQPPLPEVTNVEVVQPNCEGADGSITITAESTMSLVYSINGPEGPWIDTNLFIDLAGGSYELYVAYESLECIVAVAENPLILTAPDTPLITNVTAIDASSGSAEDGQIQVSATSTEHLLYSIDGGQNWQSEDVFNNLAPGIYLVMVAFEDLSCTEEWGEVEISIINATTDLSSLGVNRLALYPNPTQQQTQLKLELATAKKVEVSLLSLAGQRLSVYEPGFSSTYQLELDLQSLAAGVYYLKIQLDGEPFYRQLVKQ